MMGFAPATSTINLNPLSFNHKFVITKLMSMETLAGPPTILAMSESHAAEWYRNPLIQFCASAVIAILLTVLGIKLKDVGWLLIGAWPFATLAVWELARPLGLQRWALWSVFGAGAVISAVFLGWLYASLVPRVADSAVISRRVRDSGRDVWSSLNPAISTTRGTSIRRHCTGCGWCTDGGGA
jgi:hypothetical protein